MTATTPRTETVEVDAGQKPLASQEQAAIDAAHGSTGWNAYDVWRTRVFVPRDEAADKAPRANR
jgi:hypothetical protein